MTNLREAHRVSLPVTALHSTHTRYSGALLESPRQKGRRVSVWGCCPLSEATLRKAACFFENSSYSLSPVPHRRKATGHVGGQERIQFILLSSWFRMKEANTERGSEVQPVQRHWDSSKSELEREPERKEGELEREE